MANKITKIKLPRYVLRLVMGRDISRGDQLRDVAFTLPNILSLLRLLVAPLIIMCLLEDWILWAFYLFLLAMFTDFADGWFAKAFKAQTRFGAFLDPIADKVLTVSVCVWLGLQGLLPEWVVVLLISRDLLIVTGFLITWIVFDRVWVAPLAIAKLATLFQFALIALVLLKEINILPGDGITFLVDSTIYAVVTLTLLSIVAYGLQWFVRMVIPPEKLLEDLQEDAP